jgi:cardiolipin synthase A/B
MAILQRTSLITEQVLIALNNAEREIVFQMYYVDNDSVFAKYVDILVQKAKQGVSVHCLFDALGSSQIFGSLPEKQLTDAGVHVQYFNWLTPWALRNKHLLYFRNHKRVLIIDRATVHVGGWCIGEKTEHWIDGYISTTDQSSIQAGLQDFWNMYTYAHKTQLRFKHESRYVYTNSIPVSYTYQAPMIHGRYIYHTHTHLIESASKKIILIVPYFAPISALKKAIYKAQKRGVTVEIFLPKKTDITLSDLVTKTYIHRLLARGISVYLSETMLHAKIALCDDVLYVGSMNLDSVSLRYNFENGIYIKNDNTTKEFMVDVDYLTKNCTHITLETWSKRNLWEKFLDKFMKLFRAFV